jgi:O-antigen/teichoic acid export membrane protein
MPNKFTLFYRFLITSRFVKNSFWGFLSTILQNTFLGIFFVILAREYSTSEFANFLIASTIYQMVVSFSSMGLGQWFIREYATQFDKSHFIRKFFKIQGGLGVLFYAINIVLTFIIYQESQIRILAFILGLNVIFDNLIYALSRLNIAESNQKKTAIITAIDGFLRLLVGLLLFINSFSIIFLSTLIILNRLLTLALFMRIGAKEITIKSCLNTLISFNDLKETIFANWRFVLIGCVYIINWRLANVIISKTLSLQNVADYEISFKIFSIAAMIPSIAIGTIYPYFIRYHNEQNLARMRLIYNTGFISLVIFSTCCYAFIYSFGDTLIFLLFGDRYVDAVFCVKLMFLTLLVSTTSSLQASVIIAMKLEKMDLIFNVVNMLFNLSACLIGLYFFKSLYVINYSLLGAIIVFHLLQDFLLVRHQIASVKSRLIFYLSMPFFVFTYRIISDAFSPFIVFPISASILLLVPIIFLFKYQKNYPLTTNY